MNYELATVKVLLKGYFKIVGINQARISSTVTLIIDDHKKILVDTGSLGTENLLLAALKENKLTPDDIDYLIITHHHPDHVGNLALFKKSKIIDIWGGQQGDLYQANIKFFLKKQYKISDNVEIIKTPGHTKDSLSVLVSTDEGLVAICGDLFVKRKKEKVWIIDNKFLLRWNRLKILRKADWIVPGHGDKFRV